MIFPHAAERAVIEETQQFRLHAWRHFANLVQQHRAAIRLFKEAFFTFRRMPEQLTFNGIFRNRGAVQRQIRFCRTRAGHVHSMRQQIFPRTGIPGNQQRRRKICQLARLVDHMTHLRAHRNNLAECADVLAGKVL